MKPWGDRTGLIERIFMPDLIFGGGNQVETGAFDWSTTMTSSTRNRQRKPVPSSLTPLDYMLEVMRDPNATPARRDRAARCAAQYVHPRAADTRGGKKARQLEEAKHASAAWDAALDLDGRWPR